jgi:hypothetical protein
MIVTIACTCGVASRIVAEYGVVLPPTLSCPACERLVGTYSSPPKDTGGDALPLALQDLRVFDGMVAGLRKSLEYGDDLTPHVRESIARIADRAEQARQELAKRLDDMAQAHRMLIEGPRH